MFDRLIFKIGFFCTGYQTLRGLGCSIWWSIKGAALQAARPTTRMQINQFRRGLARECGRLAKN